MPTNPKPRILDVGCGRKKYPGSIGIDMSPAGQADVLCDWTRTPFAGSTFDEVRLIHMIEEVDDIFRVLAEAHRVEKPAEYDYYAPAQFRERRVHVTLLRIWRALGFEFLVNHFRWFRKFWEYYLCFVIRGKTVEWELEVVK